MVITSNERTQNAVISFVIILFKNLFTVSSESFQTTVLSASPTVVGVMLPTFIWKSELVISQVLATAGVYEKEKRIKKVEIKRSIFFSIMRKAQKSKSNSQKF